MRTKSVVFLTVLFAGLITHAAAQNSAVQPPGNSPKARLSAGKIKNSKLTPAETEAQRLNEVGLVQIKAKKFQMAEETFAKALALDSGNLGVVFNLASVYLVNKKENDAIILLTKYIKIAPPDAGLNVRLGDAYFGTKNVKKAIDAYEDAYKLEPGYPELAPKLGAAYILSNNIQQAEKYLEISAAEYGKDLKILTNLSSVYLANGKPDKAITTAKKALQIKAGKELYVTLATAYEINKDYSNALISFQRAYDLGDQRDEIKRKIEALKKVAS